MSTGNMPVWYEVVHWKSLKFIRFLMDIIDFHAFSIENQWHSYGFQWKSLISNKFPLEIIEVYLFFIDGHRFSYIVLNIIESYMFFSEIDFHTISIGNHWILCVFQRKSLIVMQFPLKIIEFHLFFTENHWCGSDGGGAGQTAVGRVRRRWGGSDGGGAGQTAMGRVRQRWGGSDGGGAGQTAVAKSHRRLSHPARSHRRLWGLKVPPLSNKGSRFEIRFGNLFLGLGSLPCRARAWNQQNQPKTLSWNKTLIMRSAIVFLGSHGLYKALL